MRDELILQHADQVRALAHPLRQRIFRLLTEEALTNKQIAGALQETPPRVHFHVRELAAAGLIELVEERRVGGVVAKYYRAAARTLRLGPEMGAGLVSKELVDAILASAGEEFGAAVARFDRPVPGTRVVQETIPLTPAAMVRIQALFDAIDREIQTANEASRQENTKLVLLTYALLPLADRPRDLDGAESRP